MLIKDVYSLAGRNPALDFVPQGSTLRWSFHQNGGTVLEPGQEVFELTDWFLGMASMRLRTYGPTVSRRKLALAQPGHSVVARPLNTTVCVSIGVLLSKLIEEFIRVRTAQWVGVLG